MLGLGDTWGMKVLKEILLQPAPLFDLPKEDKETLERLDLEYIEKGLNDSQRMTELTREALKIHTANKPDTSGPRVFPITGDPAHYGAVKRALGYWIGI
jgi:hypothetical protein